MRPDLGGLETFGTNADRNGSSWGEVAESAAQWACVYGVVATIVDSPAVDLSGVSDAERARRGIAPYVVTAHPPAWAWIECEDGRVVEFAYVTSPFRSDLSTNSRATVELRPSAATRYDARSVRSR